MQSIGQQEQWALESPSLLHLEDLVYLELAEGPDPM